MTKQQPHLISERIQALIILLFATSNQNNAFFCELDILNEHLILAIDIPSMDVNAKADAQLLLLTDSFILPGTTIKTVDGKENKCKKATMEEQKYYNDICALHCIM